MLCLFFSNPFHLCCFSDVGLGCGPSSRSPWPPLDVYCRKVCHAKANRLVQLSALEQNNCCHSKVYWVNCDPLNPQLQHIFLLALVEEIRKLAPDCTELTCFWFRIIFKILLLSFKTLHGLSISLTCWSHKNLLVTWDADCELRTD